MTKYYEVKILSVYGEQNGDFEGKSWIENISGLVNEKDFDMSTLDETNNRVLTGRIVEIDDSFSVPGTQRDWFEALQTKCEAAAAN